MPPGGGDVVDSPRVEGWVPLSLAPGRRAGLDRSQENRIATSVPALPGSGRKSEASASRPISGRPRPSPGLSVRGDRPEPSSRTHAKIWAGSMVSSTVTVPGRSGAKAWITALLIASAKARRKSPNGGSDTPSDSANAIACLRRRLACCGSAGPVHVAWDTPGGVPGAQSSKGAASDFGVCAARGSCSGLKVWPFGPSGSAGRSGAAPTASVIVESWRCISGRRST